MAKRKSKPSRRMKNISVAVAPELWSAFKALAATRGMRMPELFEEMIVGFLRQPPAPERDMRPNDGSRIPECV